MPDHRKTYGRDTITKRYIGVTTAAGQAISFNDVAAHEIIAFRVHYEGSTVIYKLTGSFVCTDSADALITSDGYDEFFAVGGTPGQTLVTVKPPSGTCNISVVGIRG